MREWGNYQNLSRTIAQTRPLYYLFSGPLTALSLSPVDDSWNPERIVRVKPGVSFPEFSDMRSQIYNSYLFPRASNSRGSAIKLRVVLRVRDIRLESFRPGLFLES